MCSNKLSVINKERPRPTLIDRFNIVEITNDIQFAI